MELVLFLTWMVVGFILFTILSTEQDRSLFPDILISIFWPIILVPIVLFIIVYFLMLIVHGICSLIFTFIGK